MPRMEGSLADTQPTGGLDKSIEKSSVRGNLLLTRKAPYKVGGCFVGREKFRLRAADRTIDGEVIKEDANG